MYKLRNYTVLGLISLSVSLLASCRAEEQGRVIMYEPGVYLGKADTKLSNAQVRSLRQRSGYQGDSVYRSRGGGAKKSDVRKPVANKRVKKQGNSN
jgi:hypothetical protein